MFPTSRKRYPVKNRIHGIISTIATIIHLFSGSILHTTYSNLTEQHLNPLFYILNILLPLNYLKCIRIALVRWKYCTIMILSNYYRISSILADIFLSCQKIGDYWKCYRDTIEIFRYSGRSFLQWYLILLNITNFKNMKALAFEFLKFLHSLQLHINFNLFSAITI